MNKSELVAYIAEETGVSKTQVNQVLGSLVGAIIEDVKNGNSLALPGLGTFNLTERSARKGRNPRTGEEMDIPASKTMKFKPGKAVKDALN